MSNRLAVLLVLSALGACGGGSAPADGGGVDLGGRDTGSEADASSDASGGHDAGPDAAGCGDADGDGHRSTSCGGDDCDDADRERYPGNAELCDAVDQDCDPATLGPDADHDGFPATTCCDGSTCGSDCDDTSHDVSPMAPESCNDIDDNCNGVVDDMLTTYPYRPDCDGDLFGSATATPMMLCGAPSAAPACPGGGWVTDGGDCDDMNPGVHPSAAEICNHLDDNCNLMVDEGLAFTTYHSDCDSDGHGSMDPADAVRDCATPPPRSDCPLGGWTTSDASDCCDHDQHVFPGQTVAFGTPNGCGNFDYNCDGIDTPSYGHDATLCGTTTITGPSCTPTLPSSAPEFLSGPAVACGASGILISGCPPTGTLAPCVACRDAMHLVATYCAMANQTCL